MKAGFRKRLNLTISLVLFVFGIMMATLIFAGGLALICHRMGFFNNWELAHKSPLMPILGILLICVFIGTALTALISKKALRPIRKVIDATQQVAQGNFDVLLDNTSFGEIDELFQSFNKMAQELASIETLRSDFVNHFSHEFKTPIVSVRGFAKLLKENNLSEEEREEYLDIIIAESQRLSELSTSVLNLSKYENIEIIPDKALFRLDEQIRRAILLTEPRWAAKDMNINVEMSEVPFYGNEDLMQQIWVNLLDNAIKYSANGGRIHIRLAAWNGGIRFSIEDEGPGMDDETKARIFDKFYQGDSSRSNAGNGLGLAIVKQIIALCGGQIEVQSKLQKGSVFIITLP